jgi:hypothetical protein
LAACQYYRGTNGGTTDAEMDKMHARRVDNYQRYRAGTAAAVRSVWSGGRRAA